MSEWVSVKNRLPLVGSPEALCCTDCGSMLILVMDYYSSGEWVFKNMKRLPRTVKVTHWMPLPELPK